jgi:anti-sigma factor RsiW
MEHPTEDVLLRFVLCASTRQENRLVVRHLLARCPTCAATLRQLRNEPPCQPPRPEEYDAAFARAVASLRELSRTKAHPPHRPRPANIDESGEVGRRPGFLSTGSAAPRRFGFG